MGRCRNQAVSYNNCEPGGSRHVEKKIINFKRKRKKENVHEEILKGGGYFYYLDCGDGFMGVCTFLICVAFYISIIPNKAI